MLPWDNPSSCVFSYGETTEERGFWGDKLKRRADVDRLIHSSFIVDIPARDMMQPGILQKTPKKAAEAEKRTSNREKGVLASQMQSKFAVPSRSVPSLSLSVFLFLFACPNPS